MNGIGANEVCFIEPSQLVPFLMTVDKEGFLDVDDRLLCLHFNIQHGPMVLVEREEYDDDMGLMQTLYQRPRYSDVGVFYRVTSGFYKVQWVGKSVTPGTESRSRSPRSSPIIQRSSGFHSTERFPTVFEVDEVDGEKIETSWIEVLCLSSDSEAGHGEESDSDSSHSGEQDVVVLGSPKVGRSRTDLFGGTGIADVGSVDSDWASREGVSGGSRHSLSKSTTDNTASHFESLIDIPSSECIPKTISTIGGGMGISHRPGVSETPLRGFGSLSVSTCTPQSKPMGVTSVHVSSNPPALGANKSIMDLLLLMGTRSKSGRSILKTVDLSTFKHEVVKFLPVEYNGNCIFELPQVAILKVGGLSHLDGMDRKRDGHVWIETTTTKISDPSGVLTFKYVKCMGHLRCTNPDCRCIEESNKYNELLWSGSSLDILIPRPNLEVTVKCKLVCRFCKVTPTCLELCPCKLFYTVSKDLTISRACIHMGIHLHPVAKGDYRVTMDQIQEEVKLQVAKTPSAKASAIGIAVGKELLIKGFINKDGDGKLLSESELSSVLEKWSTLSSLTMENVIYDAKLCLSGGGYVDSILKLKKRSKYDYIQDNRFLGQGSKLAYIFKMSTVGPGSGVDLVWRMQSGGDLKLQWIIFDHVKRISHKTTLGVHVYEPNHCKVMTICVCDMKSEMAEHQKQMWRSLLMMMEKHE